MKINFSKDKSKAIAIAQQYLTLNNPPDFPNAYVIGRVLFSAALEIFETALKTERTAEKLHSGWLQYFVLKTLADSPQFRDWLDFAQTTYIHWADDFLPVGWPRTNGLSGYADLGSCQNLLEACISFSWTFSRFADAHFKSIANPSSRKATDAILREFNNAFDNLAVTLRDVYNTNISSDLTKVCNDSLTSELERYVRGQEAIKESNDESKIINSCIETNIPIPEETKENSMEVNFDDNDLNYKYHFEAISQLRARFKNKNGYAAKLRPGKLSELLDDKKNNTIHFMTRPGRKYTRKVHFMELQQFVEQRELTPAFIAHVDDATTKLNEHLESKKYLTLENKYS